MKKPVRTPAQEVKITKTTYTKEEIEIINVKQLLTVKEAAVVLGVCSRSVYHYIYSDQLQTCRLGRAIRIQRKELDRFIEANTR